MRGLPRGPTIYGHALVRDEARRFPQGGIFLGRPTLPCNRELGILETAELTWLEKGSVSRPLSIVSVVCTRIMIVRGGTIQIGLIKVR